MSKLSSSYLPFTAFLLIRIASNSALQFQSIKGYRPELGYVGSFSGPQWGPADAPLTCSTLVAQGSDTQIYFVHAESPCSDLAQYNYTEYAFLGIDLICTGVGQGYFLNFPAPTVAPPITWVGADAALDPNAAGAYACNKFKYFRNQTEITFTLGYDANVECPINFTDSTKYITEEVPTGYNLYYSLRGSKFPDCNRSPTRFVISGFAPWNTELMQCSGYDCS